MSTEHKPTFKVVVEAGPNQGIEFAIPAAGARVGRSRQNDIALTDPLLSRHHCRFELRGADLWVIDLASANQTFVNDKPIEEAHLATGSIVSIGNTVMRVVSMLAESPTPPIIDLGLERREETPPPPRHALRPLLWSIGGAAILLIGSMLILMSNWKGKPVKSVTNDSHDLTLQVNYEKIEADSDGIFRYHLMIMPNNTLSIRIDDLNENRHVRKEKPVDPDLLQHLANDILATGCFKLDPSYTGINSRPDAVNTWDMTIIVGKNVWHCRVANRIEPEVFREVREKLETFGKNELSIWAIQFKRDKLVELANDSYLRGRKKYDERDIQYDNLFRSIQLMKETEFYLETVEPKPEFFASASECKRRATEDLDHRYQEQHFRADRALKLQDWPAAAQELRILLALIPDRNDDRYKDATRNLLDVEAHLEKHHR